jgi:hypothetical protein
MAAVANDVEHELPGGVSVLCLETDVAELVLEVDLGTHYAVACVLNVCSADGEIGIVGAVANAAIGAPAVLVSVSEDEKWGGEEEEDLGELHDGFGLIQSLAKPASPRVQFFHLSRPYC